MINNSSILSLRAGGNNLRESLRSVLLEVLVEELAELGNLLVELVLASGPGTGGVEDLVGDVGGGLGDLQVEDTEVLVLDLGELAGVDGVEDRSGVLQGASLATVEVGLAGPASVEEPCVGVVLGHLIRQHLGVLHGVQDQEGLAEAGREGSLGLGDTLLSAGHLGGVTGDEVVHDLLVGELGDGGDNTSSVTGEQDDVGGVRLGNAGQLGVGDELDGVRASGVLGEGSILVVDLSGKRVEDNVLKDGAELDGVENIGLLLLGETEALGVAATLDVEDTSVGPAVLVITDQESVGVSGEGSLTGTGETEEEGHVTVLALVGGGVQGEHIVLDGHEVEHDSEDTLLHLTSVLGTENEHLHGLEVDVNGGVGGHSRGVSVSGEGTGVVDGKVGLSEVSELLLGGSDQHVSHEQSVVGSGTDDSHLDSVLGVPSSVGIHNVDSLSGVEVVNGSLSVDEPRLLGQLLVNGSPPDVVNGTRLVDDSLVLGGSAGLLSGRGHEGTGGVDGGAGLLHKGVLVERGHGRVVLNVDTLVLDVGNVVEFLLDFLGGGVGLDALGVQLGLVNGRRHGCGLMMKGKTGGRTWVYICARGGDCGPRTSGSTKTNRNRHEGLGKSKCGRERKAGRRLFAKFIFRAGTVPGQIWASWRRVWRPIRAVFGCTISESAVIGVPGCVGPLSSARGTTPDHASTAPHFPTCKAM